MKRPLGILVGLSLIAACSTKKDAEGKAPPLPAPVGSAGSGSAGPAAPAPAPSPALDLAGMDKATKPGDDFFRHANGTWFDKTEIPADRSSWGAGAITSELTSKRVAELIKDAAASAPAGSEARKVGDFYAAYLDEGTIETKGLAPLQPTLDKITAIKDTKDLASVIGGSLRADVDGFNNTNYYTPNLFGVWVAQDLIDPAKYSVFLLQGGLGMPDRDYYTDKTPKMEELRGKYVAHVTKVLELAKHADPKGAATRIMALETQIANVHVTRTDSHKVENGKTRWSRADFDKKAPGPDWGALFDAAQLGKLTDFVVWHPKATTGIAALVKSVPLATWKEYLTFRAVDAASPLLPKAFVDERFAFYGTALAGTPTLPERWKRGVDMTSDAMGEAVGKLYVAKYFPESAKQRIAAMTKNILAAFEKRIEGLAWMAPATKAKAKAKLAVLRVGVGFPDTWRDYGGLVVAKDDAYGNAQRAELFQYASSLAKLGKPVDRSEWVMTPHLVNAVNLPAMNAMNFPAGILQPPYFDPSRPEAMDYGAIGSIIGHEISHSFDDQGALFDDTGKLQNWWTKEDLAHFKKQGAALVAQYDAYKPFPDLAVNGTLTLSENIADVAGLAASYDAYRASLGGKEAPVWEGLTGDQQFFISFAQAWRGKYREPALRNRIKTNGHAPNEYRADTVRNLDAWYEAFGVKPGEKLHLAPEARVRVW